MEKYKSRFLITLLLSTFFMTIFIYSEENYNPIVIVPGEKVGEFVLGESNIKNIIDKIGKENIVAKKVKYKEKNNMAFICNDQGLIFYFDYETKILNRIDVFSTGINVSGSKIHVGSDSTMIEPFFGKKDTLENELTYNDAGISFHIRTEDEKQKITTKKKNDL